MSTTVFIAGGGTGGHVYPALSIAEAFNRKFKGEVNVHFVGTARGIESKVIPGKGYNLHLLRMGRFAGVSPLEKVLTLVFFPFAFLQALVLILRYRPKVILGVGGYASVPALVVGALLGRSTYVWEPNAMPGMANQWLSKFCKYALVVFDVAKKKLSSKYFEPVGIPVRHAIEAHRAEEKRSSTAALRILIFGGSQGARGINKVVMEALETGGEWIQGVELVHQVGRQDFQSIHERYQNLKFSNVSHFEFLNDMEYRYEWADFVICRAGASTVAELAAMGQASWLIPFPGAGNHQKENALELTKQGAAMMSEQSDFTVDEFIEKIELIKKDREILQNLSQNIRQFHTPQAAEKIVDFIWNTK